MSNFATRTFHLSAPPDKHAQNTLTIILALTVRQGPIAISPAKVSCSEVRFLQRIFSRKILEETHHARLSLVKNEIHRSEAS